MKRAGLVVALLVVAAVASGAQRWVEDYERGLAAVAAQDWTQAAIAMQSAARQKPDEAVTLKLRRRTVAYVPWYWLGVAQLESGDPAAAIQSFKTSEAQGVIAKTPLYGDFRKALARAQAAVSTARGGAAAPKAGSAAFQEAIRAAVASQGKAMLAGATRSETYRKGSLKLQEARERARPETAEALADAARLAKQADELFRRASEQTSARKTSKTVRAQMQPSPLAEEEGTAADASDQLAQAPAPEPAGGREEMVPAGITAQETAPAAPSPRLLATAESMLRSLRKEAGSERVTGDSRVVTRRDIDQIEMRLLGASTDAEVAGIQREIARELEDLREITAAARKAAAASAVDAAALEGAYRALAAGNPEEAERQLSDVLAGSESAEAYLLRGCARFTQGTLTKRKDLVDAARDDLARALRMNAKLRLDDRSFSPKLLDLLDEVRRGL